MKNCPDKAIFLNMGLPHSSKMYVLVYFFLPQECRLMYVINYTVDALIHKYFCFQNTCKPSNSLLSSYVDFERDTENSMLSWGLHFEYSMVPVHYVYAGP